MQQSSVSGVRSGIMANGFLLATMLHWTVLTALAFSSVPATATRIIYPRPETPLDARTDYPLRLLQLAISKSGTPLVPEPSAVPMQQGRALIELAANSGIHIVWSMTSTEREERLLPIRIPIYKGLIGWRIPLVPADRPETLAGVVDLASLQAFTAGQGHDWPDTEILVRNGLPVKAVDRYDSLFRMLTAGRFAYFPRSVVEIWEEAKRHPGVIIDQHLVLQYPTAFYYFVNLNNGELAETVRRGLELALADGSFDTLFYGVHAEMIRKARFDERVVIRLNNPVIPPETPLGRRELWFYPDDLLR